MIQLKRDSSYLWLFPIFVVIFVAAVATSILITGNPGWGFFVMPLWLVGSIALQAHSGIALDSWWRARHPKGTTMYTALIAWQVFGALASLGLSFLAVY